MNVNSQFVASALNFDATHSSIGQLHFEIITDLPVFCEIRLVIFGAEPLALPVGGDTEAKAVWIDLLAHLILRRFFVFGIF